MGTLLPENRSEHKISDVDNPDPLHFAVRAQQNFSENVPPPPQPPLLRVGVDLTDRQVPYALFLIALGEMNGIPSEWIQGFLGSLFALRVLHVELGLYGKGTLGYGRPIGYVLHLRLS